MLHLPPLSISTPPPSPIVDFKVRETSAPTGAQEYMDGKIEIYININIDRYRYRRKHLPPFPPRSGFWSLYVARLPERFDAAPPPPKYLNPPVKTRRWECDRTGSRTHVLWVHDWGQCHSSEKVSCDEWYWNPSPDISGYMCGSYC